MIVSNANQTKLISFGKKNRRTTNVDLQPEKLKTIVNPDKQISPDSQIPNQKTDSQYAANPSATALQENTTNGSHLIKNQFSWFANFAISQYQSLSNFETDQARNSLLGFNEYA